MFEKDKLLQFFKEIPNNIFAGFVVSLVAMPLGLGLALASGAPPMAGVVAGIVGGIVVSILGGSHISITGPGNGLVVAVLSAITVLGAGDMYQGYLYTLAAIICSGAIILILAFAKLGKMANFFPSTAIQGLLAAIGIIILSKQFHIMVGDMDAKGSTIDLLLSIPHAIYQGFSDEYKAPAAVAGVASLFIMVYYAKIRNKYFQLIPAPMWIVVISIGLAYIFEQQIGMKHPIPKEFFVQIPPDVFASFPSPNFSKMFTGDFIGAVFTITMIASIESLLSIKAIDKLDPQRRQSKVSKDLKALGIATMISGFLGGLNVVTVIARSSVNVNNNATNRSSNFFQSVFLIAFILLFTKQLEHIPFPALAAILVYTGYKLAAPSILEKIAKIGKEQVFIFLVTLIATLFTSIVWGIVVGILVTVIVHIYLMKSADFFFKNIRINNIESIKKPDGTQYITVKHYSSFINYFRLRNAIDAVGTNKSVVVDFLQSRFVDHTVLENMSDYQKTFDKNGGSFELKGLDLHKAESEHPSALRRVLDYVPFMPEESMTKRQKRIADYFSGIDWQFSNQYDYLLYFLSDFNYFRTRQVDHIYNEGKDKQNTFKFFDIEYSEGAFIAEEELHASMLYINCRKEIPAFTLDKEGLYEKMQYFNNYKEVRLQSFRDFAERFSLRSNDNLLSIRRFFNEDLILFFESNKYYHIESNGQGGILIMDKERQSGVGEIKAMVDFAVRLEAVINPPAV